MRKSLSAYAAEARAADEINAGEDQRKELRHRRDTAIKKRDRAISTESYSENMERQRMREEKMQKERDEKIDKYIEYFKGRLEHLKKLDPQKVREVSIDKRWAPYFTRWRSASEIIAGIKRSHEIIQHSRAFSLKVTETHVGLITAFAKKLMDADDTEQARPQFQQLISHQPQFTEVKFIQASNADAAKSMYLAYESEDPELCGIKLRYRIINPHRIPDLLKAYGSFNDAHSVPQEVWEMVTDATEHVPVVESFRSSETPQSQGDRVVKFNGVAEVEQLLNAFIVYAEASKSNSAKSVNDKMRKLWQSAFVECDRLQNEYRDRDNFNSNTDDIVEWIVLGALERGFKDSALVKNRDYSVEAVLEQAKMMVGHLTFNWFGLGK